MSATVTRTGKGFLVACSCKWERFAPSAPTADRHLREHEKKCAPPVAEPTPMPAPKRRPAAARPPITRSSWDDREESTWIDKM